MCGSPIGNDVRFDEIKLLDVYNDSDAKLIAQYLLSEIKYTVTQFMEGGELPINWMLLDISFLFKQVKERMEMPAGNQFKPYLTTVDEICEGLSPEGKYSHCKCFCIHILNARLVVNS